MTKRTERLLRNTARLGAIGFLVSHVIAVSLYPGGSYTRPSTSTHDFTRNYLCDLVRPIAHNGDENPARFVAIASFLALGLGLLALFAVRTPSRSFAWRLAIVAFVVGLVHFLFPLPLGAHVHAIAIGAVGIPAFAMTVSIVARDLRSNGRLRLAGLLGLVGLGLALVVGALYVFLLSSGRGALGDAPGRALALGQRCVASFTLAWMIAATSDEPGRSAP